MPFVDTYAVQFANGNLAPHLNPQAWPDLALSPPTNEGLAERSGDATGYNLRITRNEWATRLGSNCVYLVPPQGLPLDTRLLMTVEFDLPRAEPLEPSGTILTSGVPEPWAVALSVSLTNDLLDDRMVNVTCQFNRTFDGVRLNTPSAPDGTGALQTDKAACLESPLNYSSYQGGYTVLPNGREFHAEPPVFTLEHSFSGWNAAVNGHVAGSGSLRISRTWREEVRDHRVFSSNALERFFSEPDRHAAISRSTIRALGVSLVTLGGVGRMAVRLRSFKLALNHSIVGEPLDD